MAKKLEFVAGIVDALELMKRTVSDVPQIAAEEFLTSTLVDVPTPPRDTGELRQSGAVYVGSRLAATAQSLAVGRSRVTQDMLEPRMLSSVNGPVRAGSNPLRDAPFISKQVSAKKLQTGGVGRSSRKTAFPTVRGKITVVYEARHAALMHEWTGVLHEPGSGAGFISSKVYRFMPRASVRIKALNETRLSGVRRR